LAAVVLLWPVVEGLKAAEIYLSADTFLSTDWSENELYSSPDLILEKKTFGSRT